LRSTSRTGRSRGSRARVPLLLTGIQLALCALAAYPAYRLGGRESLRSMLLGAGLGWATVVASYVVLAAAFRRARQIQVPIVVGGFVVRFAMLFGLLALVSKMLVVDLGQLVIWLVAFYMVLVVAEAWSLASDTGGRKPEA